MIVRRILGTLAGVAASTGTIMALEAIGHRVAGVPSDPAAMNLPILFVLAAWLAGTGVGGLVGNTLARWKGAAWIVAALVVLGVVATTFAIPTPWWLTVAGVACPWLVAWAVARRGVPAA